MMDAFDLLWVSATDADAVQAIDPTTNEVVATVDTPTAPDGLAFDGNILWVATEIGPELVGIDLGTHEILAEATVADHGLINANQLMVFEDQSLWLPILDDGVVLRVAPPATTVE
jgi:YVTN family beta-propeller protein